MVSLYKRWGPSCGREIHFRSLKFPWLDDLGDLIVFRSPWIPACQRIGVFVYSVSNTVLVVFVFESDIQVHQKCDLGNHYKLRRMLCYTQTACHVVTKYGQVT